MKLWDFVSKTEALDFFSCGILHFTPTLTQEIDALSCVGLNQHIAQNKYFDKVTRKDYTAAVEGHILVLD